MLKERPYYSPGTASAAFYDLVAAADPVVADDVDLYAGLLQPGGSVLELGAGTGRISAALARRNFHVVGLELEAEMLARAQRPPGVSLSYVLGDMRAFDLGLTFDAVICPYNALAHLPPTEWPAVFRCVASHLTIGGIAAFHMPIEDQMAAPGPPVGSLVFQAKEPPLQIYMAGKQFEGGRMDLILDYATPTDVRRERLTYFSGNPDAAANSAGLTRNIEPTLLGKAGLLYAYSKR